jgi:DNA-directed RNA polymerase specialized sigma24 family protein
MFQNREEIPEPKKRNNQHPRVEQLFIKMAVESLSKKHQEMWFLWNNERLTQDEIAKVYGLAQSTINEQLQTIEHKIAKWCELNKGAYLLLKLEHKIMNEETD